MPLAPDSQGQWEERGRDTTSGQPGGALSRSLGGSRGHIQSTPQ